MLVKVKMQMVIIMFEDDIYFLAYGKAISTVLQRLHPCCSAIIQFVENQKPLSLSYNGSTLPKPVIHLWKGKEENKRKRNNTLRNMYKMLGSRTLRAISPSFIITVQLQEGTYYISHGGPETRKKLGALKSQL